MLHCWSRDGWPFVLVKLNRVCVCVSDSKKLEMELQALKDNNARLMDTLQEADSNAESWKSKVTQSQDENNQLRNKVKRVEKQRRSSASL